MKIYRITYDKEHYNFKCDAYDIIFTNDYLTYYDMKDEYLEYIPNREILKTFKEFLDTEPYRDVEYFEAEFLLEEPNLDILNGDVCYKIRMNKLELTKKNLLGQYDYYTKIIEEIKTKINKVNDKIAELAKERC